ncbi:subtype B tannase [Aquincola tertiaricarbonis]|uniref:subtype B tannase n=1 Tax=Aquincola tertiaricarbonis TaxID=391953 RepID=UPI000B32254B|nr:subtype B tannase [Aquincola tertiaricarbonis]
MRRLICSLAWPCCLALIAGCVGGDGAPDADDSALTFDATKYTTVNVTVDGANVAVRQYRIVYVASPVKMAATQATLGGGTTTLTDPYAYQTMIVSVSEALAEDQKAALYLLVNNSGWWTSAVATTITEGKAFTSTSDTDNIGAALKAGYVVVNVGTRSRGARAADGRWAGKAPAPVVDAKAAIRYLRLNDRLMPGSAERIIMTGTSGGGGLTAAVSASGNSDDYLPFLAEIGAAGVRGTDATAKSTIKDHVFAAVAYCPINNLGNADAGYEWEYAAVRTDANTGALCGVAYSAGPQPAAATAIAASFPAYVGRLNLKLADGSTLTDATLRTTTRALVKEEIERQTAKGTAVPGLSGNFVTSRATLVNDWLTLDGNGVSATVADLDYAKFVHYVAANQALKTVVAFDAVGVTSNKSATTGVWNASGETNLFGSDAYAYSNFTEWSWNHNAAPADGSGQDDTGLSWSDYLASSSNGLATQLKLINPIAYLNTGADTAPYWYVRHGHGRPRHCVWDADAAESCDQKRPPQMKDVSFKFPYLVGHSGNYDVQEAFAWIKAKLDANL